MSGEERTVLFQLPTVISGQLACTQGTVAGRSFPLSAGTFVIGRQEGCDLVLAREPGVSKLHAKIIAESGHYEVVDCESRNGTLLNGRPVQTARLRSGDEIRICNCVLRFTQTGGDLSGPSTPSPPPPPVLVSAVAPEPHTLASVDDVTLPPIPRPEALADLPPPVVRSALPWFVAGIACSVVGVFGLAFGVASQPRTTTLRSAEDVPGVPLSASDLDKPAEKPQVRGDAAPQTTKGDDGTPRGDAQLAPTDVGSTRASTREPTTEPSVDGVEEPRAQDAQEKLSSSTPVAEEADAPTAQVPQRLWYEAQVHPVRAVTLKARGAATVSQVFGKDGAEVRRGELLLVFEDADDDEVANLRANIESLEIVADIQASAAETLEVERGKLRRLLARRGDNKLSAPIAGVLQGFEVEPGTRLAAGDKLGQILPSGSSLRAVVPSASPAPGWRRGGRVELRSGGTRSSGKIVAVQDKGETLEVEIATGASLKPPVEIALP
ncbi:MAG: FHA domain-containing protein [Myxococcota bacterium]